jgi:hypothetical protein
MCPSLEPGSGLKGDFTTVGLTEWVKEGRKTGQNPGYRGVPLLGWEMVMFVYSNFYG